MLVTVPVHVSEQARTYRRRQGDEWEQTILVDESILPFFVRSTGTCILPTVRTLTQKFASAFANAGSTGFEPFRSVCSKQVVCLGLGVQFSGVKSPPSLSRLGLVRYDIEGNGFLQYSTPEN
jgi:hypothetical protein